MISIYNSQVISGVTVYPDSDKELFNTFYLLPAAPIMRRNNQGDLNFSFFKYRFPVDRPDGDVGGGYVLFDVAFVVPQEQLPAIKEELQQQVNREAQIRGISPAPRVKIGDISYLDGTTNLLIAEAGGALVEKVDNPSKPSLYGQNTTTFAVELTPEGATFFEQAMQAQGPSVSVEYSLTALAALPPCTATGTFHAESFYTYLQTVDTEMRFWSEDERTETITEYLEESESLDIQIDLKGQPDDDIKQEIRAWVFDTMMQAVERRMIEAAGPVPDDMRDMPDHIEDLTRDFSNEKISDFTLTFNEESSIKWTFHPNGTLPSLASTRDPDGNAYVWDDYASTIDLDDPEFRKIRVNTMVNADFATLPLHSVEVKLDYKGRPMPNLEVGEPEGEVVLSDPSAMGKFAAFVQDDDYDYTYSYQINYTGESRIFQSPPITTNEGNLTISVGDLGILDVQIGVGDINWSDVDSALVMFNYEDRNVDPISRQFTLTQANPEHRITAVIFEPMRRNYTYQVKYFMKDGSEFLSDVDDSRSPHLFINDVFSASRTILVNGVADFDADVANIFLDLNYDDADNDYHQNHAIALNASSTFNRWEFPVVSATGGTVTYAGTVTFKNGTSEAIESTVAETDTILVPAAVEEVMNVDVIPDLIDWSATRLARVSLSYSDPANGVQEQANFIFSPTKTNMQTWTVRLKDKTVTGFNYTLTFFQTDGTQIVKGPDSTSDRALILDPLA